MSKTISDNVLSEFIAEGEEILQRVSARLTQFEGGIVSPEGIDSLYRDVHTLKGSSQLFGFQSIGTAAHAIEAILDPIRQKKIEIDATTIDLLFKCLDLIEKILKDPSKDLEKAPELEEELIQILPRLMAQSVKQFKAEISLSRDAIPEQNDILKNVNAEPVASVGGSLSEAIQQNTPQTNDKVTESAISATPSSEKSATAEAASKANPEESAAAAESTTIRVQVGLLDKLMNLVGEMVLVRNQVLQHSKNSEDGDYLGLTQRLDLVTSELQDNVMKTRMQPIGGVFSKFQRVVRDLARDLNKQIELQIFGAETELDKSLIEAIKDPLTHLIRNACDHGLETTEQRKEAKKPDLGLIMLKAYHEGGYIIIEIADNGRGVDPEKVLRKALDKKIISPEQANMMSSQEIQELIFAPGFSTAEQVSSVSGRGVGMDVVKTNIEKVGGIVELNSVLGKGTTIQLKIPLTLAIVPAMIVKFKEHFFAIPQVKLQELLRVDMEDDGPHIEKLQEQLVFRLRGQLLPLVSMESILEEKPTSDKNTVYNIAVLNSETTSYGLIVDEVCDTADIVVKALPQFLKKMNMFSGATIMGDGGVALIVDVKGFAEKANISQKSTESFHIHKANPVSAVKEVSLENSEYLFFKLSQEGMFCIPLVLVHRLEEFKIEDIEYSGDEKLIQYRDGLLPLISLNDYLGVKNKDVELEGGNTSVVVVSKRNRLFGLQVNEIIDVVTCTNEIISLIKEKKGILGTIMTSEKNISTVLDALGIIEDVIGIPLASKSESKLAKAKVRKKILLAEDTAFFVKQVTKVLENSGFDVTHAEDGLVALNLLTSSNKGSFDLVVSDIEMPNMNGFELAKSIRDNPDFKAMPLVALTTRFREVDQEKGKEVGFNKYLEKLKSDELIVAIGELIGG